MSKKTFNLGNKTLGVVEEDTGKKSILLSEDSVGFKSVASDLIRTLNSIGDDKNKKASSELKDFLDKDFKSHSEEDDGK